MSMIGELSLGFAHDISNLLAAMEISLAVSAPNPMIQGLNLEMLRRTVQESQALVSKLLTLGSSVPSRLGRVDVLEAARSAVEIASSMTGFGALGRVRCIIRRTREPLPLVAADLVELRHVFVNLLLNARDAMPAKGGTVTITARATKERTVRVTVRDTGYGIPMDILPFVFDPFVTTKRKKGAGLGLTNAKRVIEGWGGAVAAQNTRHGGARFDLTFRTTS